MQPYSQVKAMLAMTKASLRSTFRCPSAFVFSFIFPFIFILIFGFLGKSTLSTQYKIAIDPHADTSNALFEKIKNSTEIKILYFNNKEALESEMAKGNLAGILNIQKTGDSIPAYVYNLHSTTASNDKWPQLLHFLSNLNNQVSNETYPERPFYSKEIFDAKKDIEIIRQYKTIDFILPGQLGFSLLSAGVFGVAFMFFNLRNTLVLKRFFATPISRTYIVLGEGLSRVIFQMITAVVIITVGHFAFDFTLINGWATFFEMLFLSFIGLIIFMGFGFIVSGVAKSDSTIPPFANLITLPQFLLGGTFFTIDNFPSWLQPISNALPLTHLNTAMRSVAFEGSNLWEVKTEVGILLLWGIAVYAVAIKVFKWE
jgi:ABC-2 type transport system permease protein